MHRRQLRLADAERALKKKREIHGAKTNARTCSGATGHPISLKSETFVSLLTYTGLPDDDNTPVKVRAAPISGAGRRS